MIQHASFHPFDISFVHAPPTYLHLAFGLLIPDEHPAGCSPCKWLMVAETHKFWVVVRAMAGDISIVLFPEDR